MQCKACDSSVWSTVTSSTTTLGWVWFSLCCFCCLGCACLPFCTKDFKVQAKARICNLKFCFKDVNKNYFAGVQSLVSYMWMSSQNRSSKTVKDKNNPYCHRINIWCNILAYFVLYVFEGAWSI